MTENGVWCRRCQGVGGSPMRKGHIVLDNSIVQFKTEKSKLLKELEVHVCATCGHVELVVSLEEKEPYSRKKETIN
jgi:hypothetical protein